MDKSFEQQNAVSLFLRDRRAVIAVAIVAASFLPLTSSGSLINVESQVTAGSQAMSSMAILGGSSSLGLVTLGLNLLLTLYLLPVTAVVVVVMAFASRDTRSWGALSGLAALLLPIFIPFVAGQLVLAGLPQEYRVLSGGQQGGGLNLMAFGIGAWALVLLGVAQLCFSVRRD